MGMNKVVDNLWRSVGKTLSTDFSHRICTVINKAKRMILTNKIRLLVLLSTDLQIPKSTIFLKYKSFKY